MSAVLDAAFALVHDYPGGALSLAPRIRKSPATLSHEVSQTGAFKFGLDDAVRVSKLSGDLGILNAFAAELGCFVITAPEARGGNIFKGLADASREFGEFVASVADAVYDHHVTENDLKRARKEFGELVAQGQVVIARMAAMHEADKPSSSEKSTS